jgi:nicotinate-nucleotide adenylyltransferase
LRGQQQDGEGRALGVLGSAFNPPHLGHMVLAQEAVGQLGLSRVLLVPTGRAPHKRIADDPGAAVRLEMATAAANGDLTEVVSFEVDEAERSDEPSYAYRTLEALADEHDEELVWIMGADAAAGLAGWRSPERILELARVAVAERPGIERERVEEVLERLGRAERASFVDMPEIGVSSSMVRARVAAGRPIRYLVPEGVADVIQRRGLYA